MEKSELLHRLSECAKAANATPAELLESMIDLTYERNILRGDSPQELA